MVAYMRISELAERAGVTPSTLRFYERIGLMAEPERTESGYRTYNEAASAQLLFITRAKRVGLTLEQIGELLPVWAGRSCAETQRQVLALVEAKRAEVLECVRDLQRFADRLYEVGAELEQSPPPVTCCDDLSCCVPDGRDAGVRPALARGADRPSRRQHVSNRETRAR